MFAAYLDSLAFFLKISLISFMCFFKNQKDNEEFFIVGY